MTKTKNQNETTKQKQSHKKSQDYNTKNYLKTKTPTMR